MMKEIMLDDVGLKTKPIIYGLSVNELNAALHYISLEKVEQVRFCVLVTSVSLRSQIGGLFYLFTNAAANNMYDRNIPWGCFSRSYAQGII